MHEACSVGCMALVSTVHVQAVQALEVTAALVENIAVLDFDWKGSRCWKKIYLAQSA